MCEVILGIVIYAVDMQKKACRLCPFTVVLLPIHYDNLEKAPRCFLFSIGRKQKSSPYSIVF